mmetsp:Transcript_17548/g.52749  ORF Transcript_17548/g.52749 Transcript_17548/m.52749 type:complete len:212 (+) Transcript_17548:491-1126(+)
MSPVASMAPVATAVGERTRKHRCVRRLSPRCPRCTGSPGLPISSTSLSTRPLRAALLAMLRRRATRPTPRVALAWGLESAVARPTLPLYLCNCLQKTCQRQRSRQACPNPCCWCPRSLQSLTCPLPTGSVTARPERTPKMAPLPVSWRRSGSLCHACRRHVWLHAAHTPATVATLAWQTGGGRTLTSAWTALSLAACWGFLRSGPSGRFRR